MAVLYITEYHELGRVGTINRGNYLAPIPQEPPVTTQAVTFTTATQSATFNANTNLVLIESDTDCHVLFGTDPTATTSSPRMGSENPQFRGVTGGNLKLSVVLA